MPNLSGILLRRVFEYVTGGFAWVGEVSKKIHVQKSVSGIFDKWEGALSAVLSDLPEQFSEAIEGIVDKWEVLLSIRLWVQKPISGLFASLGGLTQRLWLQSPLSGVWTATGIITTSKKHWESIAAIFGTQSGTVTKVNMYKRTISREV